MQRKSLAIEAMDDTGKGVARLGSLSEVDHDEDTYQAGAFMWKGAQGQWSQILPAHDWRAMPLGKARVYESGDAIMAEFSMNLDHQAGRDWHAALKFDLAQGQPIQEWSYGFNVLEADYQIRGNSRVRVLKRLDVMEISPVLRGAGVGTGTVALKNVGLKDERFTALIGELGGMADLLKADPKALSASGAKQLGEIHTTLTAALKALAGEVIDGEPDPLGNQLFAAHVKTLVQRHLKEAVPAQ